MRILSVISLCLVSGCLAFGQLDSDTLTIAASRFINLFPDQGVFNVYVNSDLNTSLDQVVAALQSTGVTAANLSGLSSEVFGSLPPSVTTATGVNGLQWSFTLSVPFGKMANTEATLVALQKTIGQNKSGLTLTFRLLDLEVSSDLRESHPCLWPDLVTNARAQAQKLADAAGLFVGPMLSLSDQGASASPGILVGVPAAASRAGSFAISTPATIGLIGLLTTPVATPSCSLVVKFKLLR